VVGGLLLVCGGELSSFPAEPLDECNRRLGLETLPELLKFHRLALLSMRKTSSDEHNAGPKKKKGTW
jgi:hypothetical protein